MKNNLFYILIVFIFINNQLSTAQQMSKTQTLLLKGKIENSKEKSWELGMTGYFEFSKIEIPIDKAGRFNQQIEVDGNQDIYLYLNNTAIDIYVQANDTIELYWDAKEFEKTFKIKSPNEYRNYDLQLNVELVKKHSQNFNALSSKLWDERMTDGPTKYKWINEQYNEQLQTVLGKGTKVNNETPLFVSQIYYSFTKLLLSNNLLPQFGLKADVTIIGNDSLDSFKQMFLPDSLTYCFIDRNMFYKSPVYRDFLFDYVRFGPEIYKGVKRQTSISESGDTIIPDCYNSKYFDKKYDIVDYAPALNDYYRGLSELAYLPIREWYITKSILFSSECYPFSDVQTVYKDFLPKCKTQAFKDKLTEFYSKFMKLSPGSPAFNFSLRDANGKLVSLSDYKGKVVYIDFWGIGCAPCRQDILNYVPKLHEKYHEKEVVFINICIDTDEKPWKKALSDLKLDGINLIAENWISNPVRTEYGITGIPHYMLIDRNGNFIKYNAIDPISLIGQSINEIDEALGEK